MGGPSHFPGWWSLNQPTGRWLGTSHWRVHQQPPKSLIPEIAGSRENGSDDPSFQMECRQALLPSFTQIMPHSVMKQGQAPHCHHSSCHKPLASPQGWVHGASSEDTGARPHTDKAAGVERGRECGLLHRCFTLAYIHSIHMKLETEHTTVIFPRTAGNEQGECSWRVLSQSPSFLLESHQIFRMLNEWEEQSY